MPYPRKQFNNKQEFFLDRLSMHFGSVANLYSGSANPPSPQKIYEEAIRITDKVWNYGQTFDSFPELDKKLREKFEEEQHEKRIGRYNSSEVWAILDGRIPPKKYLELREFNEEDMKRMYWGTLIHKGIQELFGFKENKYEIKIADDIVIVCKIDLELSNGGTEIFEFKTREDISSFDVPPPWYLEQCMCYLKAKGLSQMKLYLLGWGLTRRLFIIKWDEKVWERIKLGIIDYHKQVVKANRQ